MFCVYLYVLLSGTDTQTLQFNQPRGQRIKNLFICTIQALVLRPDKIMYFINIEYAEVKLEFVRRSIG